MPDTAKDKETPLSQQPTSIQNCSTCRFFYVTHSASGGGDCRIGPPTIVGLSWVGHGDGTGDWIYDNAGSWPSVNHLTDWCGEWKPDAAERKRQVDLAKALDDEEDRRRQAFVDERLSEHNPLNRDPSNNVTEGDGYDGPPRGRITR